MVAGIFSYSHLGQMEDPEFTIKVMIVQAFWQGASAEEVEKQVTDKLEKKLQETPYLDIIKSYSKPGESTIFVQLKDSTLPKFVIPPCRNLCPRLGIKYARKSTTSNTPCRAAWTGPISMMNLVTRLVRFTPSQPMVSVTRN